MANKQTHLRTTQMGRIFAIQSDRLLYISMENKIVTLDLDANLLKQVKALAKEHDVTISEACYRMLRYAAYAIDWSEKAEGALLVPPLQRRCF